MNCRSEIKLDATKNPLNFKDIETVSKDNQYVRFTSTGTDMDSKKITVPFVDLQYIATNPPRPVTGVGLFHKGNPTSGGFLSLKLFHYNYADLI